MPGELSGGVMDVEGGGNHREFEATSAASALPSKSATTSVDTWKA